MRIVVADHEGGVVTEIAVASMKLDGIEVEEAEVLLARLADPGSCRPPRSSPPGPATTGCMRSGCLPTTTSGRGRGPLASAGAQDPDGVITVTRSAGLAGPGLPVLVTDDPAWTGATHRPADTGPRSDEARTVAVVLHELSPAADGPGAAPPPAPGPRPPPQRP
jgi:hypothetical protein